MSMEDNIKSEYELLRERNIKEREAFFASLLNDEEHINAVKTINEFEETLKPKQVKRKRKKASGGDESFRFAGYIPQERRKSARIAKQPPSENTSYIDEEESAASTSTKKEFKIRKRRSTTSRIARPVVIIPPEDITEDDLKNIAVSATRKTYSSYGTTCHQCRQKTADTKTICRSGFCIGVRGQFCGPCLKGRYAESVAVALKDPKWSCPGCRDECNCSFCRANAGKPPTGILAPVARENGYQSVKHLLQDLEGKLLGFNENGQPVVH